MWFWPEELKQNENVFTVKRSRASVHPEYSVSSLKPLLNLTFMCWCFINFSWRPSFFMWCFYVSCFAFMFLALLTWLFNKVSLLFFFCFFVDALVLLLKSNKNSSEKSQLALPNTHISCFYSSLTGTKCF